jgi:aminoglycoside phosphotransferase (APT) family kinase protein
MTEPDLPLLLVALGLLGTSERADFEPLTGGVSSDIVLVTTAGGRRFCVKRALARLKVEALWEAPVGRNAAEARWIGTVAGWLPEAVPKLLAVDEAHGLFAMDYLPPETHPVWKGELLAGKADRAFAEAVGRALATIHGRSAGDASLPEAFDNDATFGPIRIEPYLLATARAHPDLAEILQTLAARTLRAKRALVHGDVSPKNILHGPRGPVFLDAECACWGDPAFDLAFCLNHLLLKGALRRERKADYLACFSALAGAYLGDVAWEPAAALEGRCASLLPALLLARVDGKSPVEYLDGERRAAVRRTARAMLQQDIQTLPTIAEHWSRADD